MKTHDSELQMIKDLLHANPKGMKITRIARSLAMNRNTVSKFLEILLMTGQVEMLEHGMSKIFILSRRTRIPTMLDRSADFIFVLDRDMKINQVNDNYLEFTGMKREDILGNRPDMIGIPVIGTQSFFHKIREAHYGTDIRTEEKVVFHGREFFFDIRVTPTVFNDGKRGITIIIGDITQEKKKLLLLKESEENFRTLFGESAVGTAVFDSTGALLTANAAFLAYFGVNTLNDLIPLTLFSMEGIPEGARDTLNTGKNVRFEPCIQPRSKKPDTCSDNHAEKNTYEFQVTPVSLSQGKRQIGYLVQLHESRILFRNSRDNSPNLITRLNSDLKYLYANHEMGLMTGIAPEAFIGKTNNDLGIPAQIATLWDEAIQGVFRTGKPAELQFPYDRGYESRLYHMYCDPEINESGQIISVISVTRDITRFKMTAAAPDENHNLLEELLSCTDEAVILVDSRSGLISFANKKAMDIFGYTLEEFVGKDPRVLVDGRIPEFFDGISSAFGKRGYFETTSRLRHGGGNFPVNLHFRPIHDDQGGLRDIVMIVRILTRREGNENGNLHLPLVPPISSVDFHRNHTAI